MKRKLLKIKGKFSDTAICSALFKIFKKEILGMTWQKEAKIP